MSKRPAIGFDFPLPDPGVQLRRGHWSTDGLRSLLLPNTGNPSRSVYDLARDVWIAGDGLSNNLPTPHGLMQFTNVNDGIIVASDSSLVVPTARVTVLVSRRKVDTTARASALFAILSVNTDHWCQAHAPYSDSKMYWEFGGPVSGYNWIGSPTTIPVTTDGETFAFVAGQRGLAMYRNGVLIASNTTAAGRSATTAALYVANGSGGSNSRGDLVEHSFFAMLDAEWNAQQVEEWTANQDLMFKRRNVFMFYQAPTPDTFDPWALTVNGVDQQEKVRTVARTIQLSRPLNERATLRFEFIPGYEADRLADIGWYAEDGTTKLFGGLLLRRKRKGVESQERTRVMACECVGYSIYGDWCSVTATYEAPTLLEVLTDLVGPTLLGKYGVTLDPDQVTGPTLAPITWERKKVKDALRELVERCPGFVVRFDADKVLKMFESGTEVSSVNVSDAEPNCMDLDWDDSPEPAATRVTGFFGGDGQDERTQTWIQAGGATSWVADVPAARGVQQPGVVLVNGVNKTVDTVPGAADYLWDVDTYTLSLDLGSLPTDGWELVLVYVAQYPFTISESIGGSPPAEPEIEREFTHAAKDYAAAQEIWAQKAAEFGLAPKFFTITSREHGWFPGFSVTLEKSERGLAETPAVITNVDLTLNSKREWMYTIAAQETDEVEMAIQLSQLTLNKWRELLARRSA